MAHKDQIAYLLKQADSRKITEEECLQMEAFLASAEPRDEESLQILDEHYNSVAPTELIDMDQPAWRQMLSDIIAVDKLSSGRTKGVYHIHFLKTAWFRYAAAVVILLAVSAYLWNTLQTSHPSNLSTVVVAPNDVLPGSQKATLTLSTGEQIDLDPSREQRFTDRSQVIRNVGGSLSYEGSKVAVFNTMTTPSGGQYKLMLPDRSLVWLNAASSITYPTAFTGNTREVTITGEVYFDISPDKVLPFIVRTASDSIIVLGTSFNVNAYPDEPAMKTSLVNGAVQINRKVIHPGEAFVNGEIVETNIEQDIAWKNGYFNFNNMDLKAVMRQLERWYNITVQYEGDIRDIRFEGKLSRDLSLSQIVEILREMGVKCRINGRKLLVGQHE